MRLSFLTIETPDMQRTAQFYRDLGVDLTEEQHGGPRHFAFAADVHAEFYTTRPDEAGQGVMLGFDVDDLEGLLARIDPAAVIKPIQTVAGMRRFIFRDPDGRRVFVRAVA